MATEAGSSYVTIFPKMAKGFGSQISKSINASGIGKKIASGISKGVIAGGATIGAATLAVTKKAFDNYAQFEQLVGGVETLFKDSAPTVEKYADNAFKTAGLSANQYMETVTSFSASMISAVGGDTAKAAELSNQAIIDMSDNANKMGTSMDEIQRAYQSMARGNYAMLDSLKLGYGGTKSEMERMLADAEKLTGKKYDISNFADITEAIHAIQDQWDITGTTAKEGSTTLEGSINQAKAAWENWLTGLGDENADMTQLTSNLVDAVSNAASLALPKIKEIVGAFAAELPGLLSQGYQYVMTDLLPSIGINVSPETQAAIESIFGSLKEMAEAVIPAVQAAFETMAPYVAKAFEVAAPIVQDFADLLVNDILPAIDSCMQSFGEMWEVVKEQTTGGAAQAETSLVSLDTRLGQMPQTTVQFSDAVANMNGEVDTNLSTMDTRFGVTGDELGLLGDAFSGAAESGTISLGTLDRASGMSQEQMQQFAQSVHSAMTTAGQWLSQLPGKASAAFNGMVSSARSGLNSLKTAVQTALATVKGFFSNLVLKIPEIHMPHIPQFHVEWSSQVKAGKNGPSITVPIPHITWNALGGVFEQPIIFGNQGFGEAGPEAALPLTNPRAMGMIADAITDRMDNRGGNTVILNAYGVNDPNQLINQIAGGIRQLNMMGA